MSRLIITIVFILLGCSLILFTTRDNNLSIDADGKAYVLVSRNILDGKGVVNDQGQLVRQWPPFYPIVLAGFSGLTGTDGLVAGRYLNAVLMALLILVFNSILSRQNVKPALMVFLNLLLLFSLPLTIYAWFYSEGLFMVLLLSALYFIFRWTDDNKKITLIITGLIGGLSLVTRYAGIGFAGGFALYILLFRPGKVKTRITNLGIYISSLVIMLIPWLIYIQMMGTSMNRGLVFHPISLSKFLSMFSTLISWIAPNMIFAAVGGVLFLILVYLAVREYPRFKEILQHTYREHKGYYNVLMLAAGSYILFLFVSISFWDAGSPLNDRMMTPVFPLLLLLLPVFLKGAFSSRYFKVITILVCVFMLLGGSLVSSAFWKEHYTIGHGYTSRAWQDSETLDYVRKHPCCDIYSNVDDAIYLLIPELKFETRPVPSWFNYMTMTTYDSFEDDLARMKNQVDSGKAQIVYFHNIDRSYLVQAEQLLAMFEGYDILSLEDGFILNRRDR
jgi:hypothetical protein